MHACDVVIIIIFCSFLNTKILQVWQTSLGEEQSAENLLIAMAKDNPYAL